MKIRHRLLARLLAGSVLVAICSITATAWIATQSTSGAIRREQGQKLTADASINDALLGFAATHRTWDGVAGTVQDLAARTGRRIALTTESRDPIADSAPGRPLPDQSSATVDPLRADANGPIDARAVAPFGLPAAERERLRKNAQARVDCMRELGVDAQITYGLSGRPEVSGDKAPAQPYPIPTEPPQVKPAPIAKTPCSASTPDDTITATESKALKALTRQVNRCLAPKKLRITLGLDGGWEFTSATGDRKIVTECLVVSRRAQLKEHVAPSALLFLGNEGDGPGQGVVLTTAGVSRIGGAALLVLVLAVAVSVVIATRLVRPVHALTGAAQRMRDGDGSARVKVRDSGELGRLATAFNDMSEHLTRLESQRKEMVSDVSHELRTPISNVRGWLEAARDGYAELDPELVSRLVDEMLLLQHVVDDLQSLALADAGKLRLHPEQVYLPELLEQISVAHRGRATEIELTTEVQGDPPLYADPVRLRQAIGNLVGNAFRYTPAGGRVTLRARRSGDQVLIEVADTGIGMDPDDLPHVFDRFWRAEKSRSRQTGGSGLGLAIVRSLVEAHGGTVTVTSTRGTGTTFTLHLPLAVE